MNAKKALIVLAVLGIFSGSIEANEKYKIEKVWPEVPRGWHFYRPCGVTVDQGGNVYVADEGNHKIKKFDSDGRFITEWGSPGKGKGQFEKLWSVKADHQGNIHTVDIATGRIQKFTPYGKFIDSWGEGEKAVSERKYRLYDLAVDSSGNVFVVSDRPARILKFTPGGKLIAQWGSWGKGDGQFDIPFATSIAVGPAGNVYVADRNNHRIQKFDPNGRFLLKWGTYGEEDGLFEFPEGITFDRAGNLYVADLRAIQKFTPRGKFLARWEFRDKAGWGQRIAVGPLGSIYLTQRDAHRLMKFDRSGELVKQWGNAGNGDGKFISPCGIAVDSEGSVIVCDTKNHRIQKFGSQGKFLSRWGRYWSAGGWPRFYQSLAADGSGNIFNLCGYEVQKYNAAGEILLRWAIKARSDRQLGAEGDSVPQDITVDTAGNVFVADRGNHCVQKFSSDGKFLAKWGTKGTADGQFTSPELIAVAQSGNILVVDHSSGKESRIQKFDSSGKFVTKWTVPCGRIMAVDPFGNAYGFTGGGHPQGGTLRKYDPNGGLVARYGKWGSGEGELNHVFGVCVDASGYVYATKVFNSVDKFDPDGNFVASWDVKGIPGSAYSYPGKLALDPVGNLYVKDWARPWIRKLTGNGKLAAEFRIEFPAGQGQFLEPSGVAVDPSENVYVVDSVSIDSDNPRIQKFNPSGEFIMQWGGPDTAKGQFKHPVSVAVDASGKAYVTDKGSHCVHKFDAKGKFIKSWGSKGTDDGQFNMPEGIAVDRSGNVYVCDRQNSRIQKFDSNGRFLTKWGKEGSGDGEFHFPAAVALDKEGNVYVADSDNNRIQKFTAEGKFLTKWGEFGEAPGQLNVPLGIAVDASGNVYVSDSHNHRIQKFAPVSSR